MSKYPPLTQILQSCGLARIEMKFSEIERIISSKLPSSAYDYRAWWGNGGHVQAISWLDAGYKVEQVDQKAKKVFFIAVPQKQNDH